MSRLRAVFLLLLVLLAVALAWTLGRSPPVVLPPSLHAPQPPPLTPFVAPQPPPEPAPHPLQPLPRGEDLSLPTTDGHPLRAHWYPAGQPIAPVLVLDVGAGQDLQPWVRPVQALLAQRPVHVLWLDDAQPRQQEDALRQARAEARWQAALKWLEGRAPSSRWALLGVQDAGDAVWRVAERPRPLSLAVIAPEGPPHTPLPPEVADRFALVALPLSTEPTPTWLSQLHNVRVHAFAAGQPAALDPQFQTDLSGWLFVALGPRSAR